MKSTSTNYKLLYIVFVIIIISCNNKPKVTINDYERAEKFLPDNIGKLVYKLSISPNWIDSTSLFWYKNETRNGKEFVFVNPVKKTKEPAFDHEKLALAINSLMSNKCSKDSLPFNDFEYKDELTNIEFSVNDTALRCNLKNYSCKIINTQKRDEVDWLNPLSPDGKWIAFVKDFNLYIKNKKSEKKIQLSKDGTKEFPYSLALTSPLTMVEKGSMDAVTWIDINWSPDSKKIVTYQMDKRNSGELHLVQSCPPDNGRPRLFSYAYPLPTDSILPTAHIKVFDIASKKQINVDASIPLQYVGGPFWGSEFDGGDFFYYNKYERGYKKLYIKEINLHTGAVRTAITDESETCVDPIRTLSHYLDNKKEYILASERDGWNHLYLYNIKTSKLINQITNGDFVVRSISYVDEDARIIYFIVSGKEEGKNPYFRHLYKINFDGSDLVLLTPENADHGVRFSDDGKYFIDNYSTVDTPPEIVLRKSFNGKIVLELEKSDIDDLHATGWTKPEEFKVKAGDDKTDIYGVIYKPANFDPKKKYPILDKIYTGPHSFFAAKSFSALYSEANSFAQLGFIVIEIDGRGTGWRSKEFHNYSYKNLGGGSDDHIVGIKQLAEKNKYMDINKVGIFGFSAGGYDTFHAMCKYPDFYKVGIAASGNHDHRVDKIWWNELWMGYPIEKHYDEQSNYNRELIRKLKGKILITHGELDNNVHPYATMRLINLLIEENKDFDMMIIPNQFHYMDKLPYYVRIRWDYFVRNLLEVEPPKEYKIKDF